MSGGGGGMKKTVIALLVDRPAVVYLSGGAFIFAIRQYQIRSFYNYHFGKIEFMRSHNNQLMPAPHN